MRLLALPCLVFLMALSPINYQKDQPIDLDIINPQLQEIEHYLQSFKSFSASFMQNSPGMGNMSKGTLELKRPGKARFDYTEPELMIIINDGKVTHYDAELDQVSYASTKETPIDILLSDKKPLREMVDIVGFSDNGDNYQIRVKPKKELLNQDDDLALSNHTAVGLVFEKNPIRLVRLHRTDGENRSTIITLHDIKHDIKIDKNRFYYRKR